MNRHASMNRIYRLVWSQVRSAWLPVAETARGRGKSGRAGSVTRRNVLAAAISMALAPLVQAGPVGGQIVSGTGSITQSGNTTATGTFTANSLGGAITQAALTAENVTGTGDVKYGIALANAGNNFGGIVTAGGRAITLKDTAALTAVLNSTGASSLTSVGALNVSGITGTTLATKTTRTNSATTVGATTVSNPNVTVNGVAGAQMPWPRW